MSDHIATIRKAVKELRIVPMNPDRRQIVARQALAALDALETEHAELRKMLDDAIANGAANVDRLHAEAKQGLGFSDDQRAAAGLPRLHDAALPADPNTRAWLGIEPQFTDEETP